MLFLNSYAFSTKKHSFYSKKYGGKAPFSISYVFLDYSHFQIRRNCRIHEFLRTNLRDIALLDRAVGLPITRS